LHLTIDEVLGVGIPLFSLLFEGAVSLLAFRALKQLPESSVCLRIGCAALISAIPIGYFSTFLTPKTGAGAEAGLLPIPFGFAFIFIGMMRRERRRSTGSP
jgi:hypothetical protein